MDLNEQEYSKKIYTPYVNRQDTIRPTFLGAFESPNLDEEEENRLHYSIIAPNNSLSFSYSLLKFGKSQGDVDSEEENSNGYSLSPPDTESTETNNSISYRMEDGQPLPKILPGPYFPRSGTVLTDTPNINEFLRIRPPMYSPPQQEKESTPDDTYEDPDKNEIRQRESRPTSQIPNPPDSQLPSSAPPYASHAYEHPISQERILSVSVYRYTTAERWNIVLHNRILKMRKQQKQYINSGGGPSSSSKETTLSNTELSEDEARGLLRKNDTGGYYIASGSAQTTLSTVSPASNRYDHSCLSRGPLVRMLPHHHYPGHESSMYDPTAPLHPHPGQVGSTTNPSSSVKRKKPGIRKGFLETSASLFSKSSKKRKSSLTSDESRLRFYKYLCIFLFLLLLISAVLLFALLIIRAKSTKDYAFYDKACSIYSNAGNFSEDPLPYSLPTYFKLGEFISAILPPGQIVYSQFSVQRDGDVTFNVSVPSGARIVMYGRQTLEPTPAMNDFRHVIHADRLHLSGPMKRIKRHGEEVYEKSQIFRSALITYYLMSGRWHLGFLNDGYHFLPITLVASLSTNNHKGNGGSGGKLSLYGEPIDECKYNCFNKGTCKDGKCHCFPGYNGKFCEETACPVLCSGNGIFTNGRCACHEGFKGPDCDLISSWCTVPHCNHHGRCIDGKCRCERGWKGEFCAVPDCTDPTCSGHGMCYEARCFCLDGWHGANCQKSIVDITINCPAASGPSNDLQQQQPQYWVVEKGGETQKQQKSPIKVEAKVEHQVENSQNSKERIQQTIEMNAEKSSDISALCSGRGRYDTTSKKCICHVGFQGPRCNAEECSPICENGKCHNGECICYDGFSGKNCAERNCLPGCELHGSCRNGTCTCDQGWNGENCYIEGCKGNCSNGGTCQRHFNQWKCFCDSEHYGDGCQLTMETDCDDGEDNDNDGLIDCEDSECCSSRECSSNPLCTSVAQPLSILLKSPAEKNANFYKRSQFLIAEDSVQRFANPSLFDENRVSVIRGHVVSKKSGFLTGVRISDVANPRYGFSLSRSEDGGGTFDLMVNGGGRITLQFIRHPYGKVEKSFFVPPNEIIFVGEVVMDDETKDVFTETKIPEKCKHFRLTHNISPNIFPSWKTSQYSGANDFTKFPSNTDSKVLADSGIVNEKISIASTSGAYLVYSSDRSDGYHSTLYISLLGSQIPEALRLVHIRIELAGRHFEKILVARLNLTYTFAWDQTNIYQQSVHGLTQAQISIGYEYEGCRGSENIIWHYETVEVEGKHIRPMDFGYWTMNFHHYFDFVNNVLERGDGRTVYVRETPSILKTVVGSDERRDLICKNCAKENLVGSKLFSPSGLAIGPDGSIYIGDYDLIRRVSPDRKQIETIFKLSTSDTSHPYYLFIDSSTGNLFVSMPLRRQIWQVIQLQNPSDPNTNYQVYAGDGSTCTDPDLSSCGDGGPAESAQLFFPKGINFDNEGNLFFVDGRRIRVITKQRQMRTVIKDKEWKPTSDGCSANFELEKLNLEWPTSIIVEPFSTDLIVLDTDIVYRIDFSVKLVKILAGIPKGCEQTSHDELTPLKGAKAIVLDSKNGALYVAETDDKRVNYIRSIPINGGPIKIITGKTGKCDCDRQNCPCDDSSGESIQIATSAMLHKPSALAVDLKGRLYIADQNNFKIKVVEKIQPEYDSKERLYKINSPGTNEIYYFNQQGLHRKTVSLLSGQALYNFSYNQDAEDSWELSEVKGVGGFLLQVNRINETDVVLEGSLAEKTHLKFNSLDKSLLETVTSDSLKKINLEYSTGQLLSVKTVNGQPIFYDYDLGTGRVKNVTTASGNFYRIDHEENNLQQLTTRVTLNDRQFKNFVSQSNEFFDEGHSPHYLIRFPKAFILNSSGMRTQFDEFHHPLLLPYDSVVLKRKIVIPALEEPPRRELTARFEWRAYVRRGAGKRITQVGRRPRINGLNVLTIEFDRQNFIDTIRDTHDNDLLTITYNPNGQVTSVVPSNTLSLPSLNVTYDNNGLPLSLEWLEKRRDFVYDQKHRLILSTYGKQGDLLKRKYSYGKDSSRNPSMVEIASSDKYKWLYDSLGGVTALKTPSDEIHNFWSVITMRPDIYQILYRQTPHTTSKKSSYAAAVDENGRLTHFVTPNKMYYLRILRNDMGWIERVDADDKSFEFEYNNLGKPSTIQSDSFVKEILYQGPLVVSVKHSPKIDSKENSHFLYEYDDLFRMISIHANFGRISLDPLKFEYNSTNNRPIRLSNYSIYYEQGKSRILSDTLTLETIYTSDRLIYKQLLTIAGSTILEMETMYDKNGRPETLIWTIFGQKRANEIRTYTINGQISQMNLDESENRWTLHYDLDGRLKLLNETKLILNQNGMPKKFGDIEYDINENGWVYKRGDFYFQYDVYGQVVRATNKKNLDITFEYDEQNRVIKRNSKATGRVQRFFYAMPQKPELVTHYSDSLTPEIIWSIHYTDLNLPFSLESSSGLRFFLVADLFGSIRFVFNSQGLLSRELNYSPTGEILFDTNPNLFFIPFGYLKNFHDFEANLIFVREESFGVMVSRPLGGQIGRFLSTSLGVVGSKIDVYQPEVVADPYGFEHGIRPLTIPNDPSLWLEFTGIDLNHLISLKNLETSNFCDSDTLLIIPGAICSIKHDLTMFSQIMTMAPTPLLSKNGVKMIEEMDSQLAEFSKEIEDFGNLRLSLAVIKNMTILVKTSKTIDSTTSNILKNLLDGAEMVPLDAFGITPRFRGNNQTFVELHVISRKPNAREITNTVAGPTVLSKDLNATVFNDRIEISGVSIKIVVHFMKLSGIVWAELFQEKAREIEKVLWKSEKDALRKDLPTRNSWAQEELKELSKNGRVSGYTIKYYPNKKNSILQNKSYWKFEKINRRNA